MFLTAERNFWPSCLMPRATSKEIAVDFLASRTRKTVPLRMSRTIGSPASERCLHQTRLTLSLPTAPPNEAASTRREARVRALIGSQRLAFPLARLALDIGLAGLALGIERVEFETDLLTDNSLINRKRRMA